MKLTIKITGNIARQYESHSASKPESENESLLVINPSEKNESLNDRNP